MGTILVGANSSGQDSSPVVVPLDLSWRNVLVEVRINGHGPYPFVLDGEFRDVELDSALVEELDLGESEGPFTVTLGVGDLELVGVPAAMSEDSYNRRDGDKPRGRVGLRPFSDHLLTLDFPNEQLILDQGTLPSADEDEILNYTEQLLPGREEKVLAPVVNMELAGDAIEVQLDLGTMAELELPYVLADVLPLASPAGKIGNVQREDKRADLYGASLDENLHIGSHVIERPSIFFSNLFEKPTAGAELFTYFAVTIDQTNRTVRFRRSLESELKLFDKSHMVEDLSRDPVDLREAFNADSDKTRMLLILAPT
jgi:hypothetical protein